ncbi:hypothetical protein JDV02_003544 [Purpureocillium takamizusanense]|uniref:Uncharacterized protein n=1 Tax=Purpureocillium takamizusanense TaxID=2060973 RepID=A0A9Q8QAT1_9HYPO|nr:uncharacterized protein JDV02_003544 [Purpureocillium takamizusanense]UNI17169.1 hypothetical protein JDV02_003544 [Purpureocillium takamizusanense]
MAFSWHHVLLAFLLMVVIGTGLEDEFNELPIDPQEETLHTPLVTLQDATCEGTTCSIVEDHQLRHTYLVFVVMLSDISRGLATKYGVSELSQLSDDLNTHIHEVNANTEDAYRLDLRRRGESHDADLVKRAGLFDKLLGGLLGGNRGAKEGNSNTDDATTGEGGRVKGDGGGGLLGGLLGGGKGGGGPISDAIGNVASNVIGKLLKGAGPGLAGAGFFGGVGAGEGAAQGLNLAPASMTKPTGEQVARENGMQNTGLNPVLRNAALGLTSTALKAVRQSGILQLPPLGPLAASLGTAVGSGAATGLRLTETNASAPLGNNATGLEGAVGSFGFGLSRSFTESINLTGPGGLTSKLPPIDFGATALDIGNGLGNGAVVGLRLANNKAIGPPRPVGPTDIPKIAGALSFGLSNSLIGNINLSSITGPGGVASMFPPVDFGATALDIGNGLGNGAVVGLRLANNKAIGPPRPAGPTDIPKIAGALSFGLSNSLIGNINISSVTGPGGVASMFPPVDFGATALGVGGAVGAGASMGFKLTKKDLTPAPPTSGKDLPGIASSFAFGATRTLSDNLNLSDVGGQLGTMLPPVNIADTALSLGSGLGNGVAQGLKLTDKDLTPPLPASPSDIPRIAGRFAFGLSNGVSVNLNVSEQAQKLGSMLPPIDIGLTALNVGAGIGAGAAAGLKLATNEQLAPPPPASQSDVPRIAGTLAFGITNAVAGSVNTTSLLNRAGMAGGLGGILGDGNVTSLLAKYGGPAASGLGKGLGSGAAVGLGLQPEASPEPLRPLPDGSLDVGRVTEDFAQGLTSRFLANGTASKALGNLSGSNGAAGGLASLTANLNIGRIANGFARGLLTGVGDGVEAIGGIKAIINGTSTPPTAPISDTKVDFNDTVSGSAVGFGQGLGTSGVVTAQKLLAPRKSDRSLGAPDKAKRGHDLDASTTGSIVLVGRQVDTKVPDQLTGLNLSRLLDADAVSAVAQKGVDTLTCDGVAALFVVGRSLQKSGTLPMSGLNDKTQAFLKSFVPQGNIRFVNGANTFVVDGQKAAQGLGDSQIAVVQAVSINGFPFSAFATFLVIHIGIAILGLFILFPLALTLNSVRNIAVRFRKLNDLPAWTPKATKLIWAAGVAPSLVLTTVFGVLPTSTSKHFQTVHEVLGLVTLIVALASLILYFRSTPTAELTPGEPFPDSFEMNRVTAVSHTSNQLLLALLPPTAISGFADLSGVTLCLTRAMAPFETAIALGLGLGSVFIVGQFVSGADTLLALRAWRKAKGARRTGRNQEIRRLDKN